MKKKSNIFHQAFKWKATDFLQVFLGTLLVTIAINVFIVPNSLYNGGILGISQLIRSLLVETFGLSFKFDVAGLINFVINVPLFIMAYKFISKTFFYRTLYVIILQTIFLTFIPIPETSIVPEIITSVLIGGILGGIGGGIILSCGGSGGGTDIIGFSISMRNKNFSVGRINRMINLVIYAICGILYGLSTMVYSIIYSVISSLTVDHTHKQNICSYVMIFTKEKPDKVIEFVKKELHRDITYWEGVGGYDNSKTYVSSSAMSKYEMQRLERHLPELSQTAFVVKSEGVGIDGNFKKNLTE